MNSRATVLVFSCDTYEDAWYPFFTLMDKYWDDCPYRILLNTESKKCSVPLRSISVDTLQLYKSGERIPYGKRCLDHLKCIDSDYVITLMDDFFIRSQVDTATLERVMDWMDKNKRIASFCLIHHDDRHSCRYLREEQGYEHFSLRPKYCNHNYDMQACIWRKSIYEKTWRPFMNPWEWEGPANYRSFDDGYTYYDLDDDASFPIDYIDYKKHEWSGIRKGKWVKETVYDLFNKHNITIDYSIRGFYDAYSDASSKRQSLHSAIREIRCYGWRRAVPATLFKMSRFFQSHVLNRENLPDSYCDYLRHRYYDKI